MPPYQPGLIDMPKPVPGDTAIQDSVVSTFDELEAKGVLGPIDRAKRTVLIKAAASLDTSLATGKISVAASNVIKQVMEGLDSLPKPTEGTDRELDALDAALAALTKESLGLDA